MPELTVALTDMGLSCPRILLASPLPGSRQAATSWGWLLWTWQSPAGGWSCWNSSPCS